MAIFWGLQTLALLANEAQFFGACSLQNEVVVPQFCLPFLEKIDHYFSA